MAFRAYYDGNTAYFSTAEQRIKRLYDWLQLGIKPWEWDYERYSGDKKEMVGFFYNDDLENIKDLDQFEKERKRRQQ